MPGLESTLPSDWFAQGDQDILAAEILLNQNGPLPIVAFHLQQAVEKYLKGYLLSQAWRLRRIHDLEVLIQEAITLTLSYSHRRHQKDFQEGVKRFLKFARCT